MKYFVKNFRNIIPIINFKLIKLFIKKIEFFTMLDKIILDYNKKYINIANFFAISSFKLEKSDKFRICPVSDKKFKIFKINCLIILLYLCFITIRLYHIYYDKNSNIFKLINHFMYIVMFT